MTDKSGERFLHVTIPWWGVIVGYIIGLSTSSVGGRYFGMFIMASGYAGEYHDMHLVKSYISPNIGQSSTQLKLSMRDFISAWLPGVTLAICEDEIIL